MKKAKSPSERIAENSAKHGLENLKKSKTGSVRVAKPTETAAKIRKWTGAKVVADNKHGVVRLVKSKKSTAVKKKTIKPKALKVLPKHLKGKVSLATLNKARREGGLILKETKKRTGTSNMFIDAGKQARKPGKRLSANGTIYYESRHNRSDVVGSL